MAIIAVYNIKGGVGKTATAVNLSYLSSRAGNATLLCDMDSQGSAGYYFRVRPPKKFNADAFLKGGKHVAASIRGTDFPGLDLLPADFTYRNIDIALDEYRKSRRRIRKILKPLTREYVHIFLDCPPNITLLSENIFDASDIILIPFIPTTLSWLSFKKLLAFFKKTGVDRRKLLVLFSMVDKRKKMHTEMMAHFGKRKRVLASSIPFLADVEKMGVYRQPVPARLPRSAAARAYENLWREVEERLPGSV